LTEFTGKERRFKKDGNYSWGRSVISREKEAQASGSMVLKGERCPGESRSQSKERVMELE